MAQETAYKSVFKSAAYIFFIKLFPAFASIAVLILYSRKLPQEVYGNYQDFWVKLLLLGTLAYVGLPVTIITYAADVIRHFIKQIRMRHLLLYMIWLVVCILAFWFFLQKLRLPVILLVAVLLLYVIHAVQEALLMATKKMNGLLFINFLYSVYFLVVHISFLDHFDLKQLLVWLLPGLVVRAALLQVIVMARYRHVRTTPETVVSPAKARTLWFHLGFYDLLQTLFRYTDKFILASFLPASLFAVYFNGSQPAEIPFLPYLLGAVASSVLLQLSERSFDPAQSYKLLIASAKLLSSIVFPLFFFLLFFAGELFHVVFAGKYEASVEVFSAAILVLPLRAYSYTTLLQHLHQGAIINKGALLDLLLGLTLMYPLYQLCGLPGVALSFVISTYIQVGYYLWHTTKLTGVKLSVLLPIKDWLVKFVLIGMLLFAYHRLLPSSLQEQQRLVAGAVAWLIITASGFFFTMNALKPAAIKGR